MSMIPDVLITLIHIRTHAGKKREGGRRGEGRYEAHLVDVREMSQELHDLRVVEWVRRRGWVRCRRTGRRRGCWWGRGQRGVLVNGGGHWDLRAISGLRGLIWAIGTTGTALGKVQSEKRPRERVID
jgi:hypothetical protein